MTDSDSLLLNLLLFSVEEVHFGIDADQVIDVNSYDGEQSEDLFWFHQEMGYRDEAVVYLSPAIISVRTYNGQKYRIIIDAIEEIAEFRQIDIHLFPAPIEPLALQSGMWGVLCRNGTMVFLVDFNRLAKRTPA